MSARVLLGLTVVGLTATPFAAMADGLFAGLGAGEPSPRPAYRQANNHFPPPQHGLFGQPVPPPAIDARRTYRQANNDFPPEGGRYGGGFIEYVMTGGRPEPIPARADPQGYGVQGFGAPGYAPQPYALNPGRTALPQGGLPPYVPGGYQADASAYASPQPVAYGQPNATYEPATAGQLPSPVYFRQEVAYSGGERPGTIIIDTPEKFLFLVEPGGRALRYGIGVGRPGFTWAGVKRISRKAEWPDWTPPSEMLLRRPDLPRHMAGGEGNPLGARALYLGSSLYRIHGTNEPSTIGTNVSSGCIRMMNGDVVDLYGRVGVGTRVVVL
jgi:lipoprotein-anchoring transpeptidase ErfK/SrfK